MKKVYIVEQDFGDSCVICKVFHDLEKAKRWCESKESSISGWKTYLKTMIEPVYKADKRTGIDLFIIRIFNLE